MPLEEASRKATLVDQVASTLMDAWEAAEGEKVNVSHIATFADMARAVVSEYLTD